MRPRVSYCVWTNGQIQYILDQALRKAGRLKKKRILKSEEKNKE